MRHTGSRCARPFESAFSRKLMIDHASPDDHRAAEGALPDLGGARR
jgi:hypothetical protein